MLSMLEPFFCGDTMIPYHFPIFHSHIASIRISMPVCVHIQGVGMLWKIM